MCDPQNTYYYRVSVVNDWVGKVYLRYRFHLQALHEYPAHYHGFRSGGFNRFNSSARFTVKATDQVGINKIRYEFGILGNPPLFPMIWFGMK